MQSSRQTYPATQFQALGIEGLQLFGRLRYTEAKERLPDHSHPHCMEICVLASGRQCFSVADRHYWLRGGQSFVTFPGEVHSTGEHPMGRGELFWMLLDLRSTTGLMGLNTRIAEHLRSALLALEGHLFDVGDAGPAMLGQLEDELQSSAPDPLRAQQLLTGFLDRLVDAARHHRPGPPEILDAVLCHIRDNLDTPLRVPDLAGIAGLSTSRFKSVFRRSFGIAPAEYVAQVRIDRARELLRATDTSITEIALSLGFSTPQYFSYVFRRLTGVSPRAYRRNTLPPAATPSDLTHTRLAGHKRRTRGD